jgi:hypothetical protein
MNRACPPGQIQILQFIQTYVLIVSVKRLNEY